MIDSKRITYKLLIGMISCLAVFLFIFSLGTVNAASVYPRDVIREAVANTAVSLILVHNHPAGSLVPSAADCQVTKLIVDSAALVGISVTDHIIITRSGWFSFAESGMLSSFIEGKRKE